MKNLVKSILSMFGVLTIMSFPVLCVLAIFGVIGGFLWTYVLNTWFVFFGQSAMFVFWQGFILGCIPYIGQSCIPLAIFTFIIMLIL